MPEIDLAGLRAGAPVDQHRERGSSQVRRAMVADHADLSNHRRATTDGPDEDGVAASSDAFPRP